MRIIPAIIIAGIALVLSASLGVRAQEPSVTPTVAPTATPLPEGRIVVRVPDLDTRDRVYFDVYESRGGEDVDDFEVREGHDRELNLTPGRYRIVARDLDGFTHEDVRCRGRDASDDTVAGDDEATIDLHDGQLFICTWYFEEREDATPTPEPTSTPLVAPTPRPSTVLCGDGTIIQVNGLAACPRATAVPTATPMQQVSGVSIKPPSTGSAGLLD